MELWTDRDLSPSLLCNCNMALVSGAGLGQMAGEIIQYGFGFNKNSGGLLLYFFEIILGGLSLIYNWFWRAKV